MDIGTLMTDGLTLATLLGNIAVVLLFCAFLFAKEKYRAFMGWLGEFSMPISFFITFGATIGSLVYSEVVGYPACILCWIQRVFMYPQAVLYFVAVWRRESLIAPYGFALSIVGGGVALYQWVKDMIHVYSGVIVPCPAVAGLPSCDTIYILKLGYITIPMIALNAFILLLIVNWASMRHGRGDN
jgi:disulfide bond formation protein DsbB